MHLVMNQISMRIFYIILNVLKMSMLKEIEIIIKRKKKKRIKRKRKKIIIIINNK